MTKLLKLTLEVEVEVSGDNPRESLDKVKDNMVSLPRRASNDGMLTTDSEAEVKSWRTSLEDVSGDQIAILRTWIGDTWHDSTIFVHRDFDFVKGHAHVDNAGLYPPVDKNQNILEPLGEAPDRQILEDRSDW